MEGCSLVCQGYLSPPRCKVVLQTGTNHSCNSGRQWHLGHINCVPHAQEQKRFDPDRRKQSTCVDMWERGARHNNSQRKKHLWKAGSWCWARGGIALSLQNPGTKSTCHIFDNKMTHTQLKKKCAGRPLQWSCQARPRGCQEQRQKIGNEESKSSWERGSCPKKKLESQAIKLLPKIAKLYRLGYGGRIVQRNLNKDAAALRMNDRKIYHLSKVQRIVKVLQKKRLLRWALFHHLFSPNSICQLCCPLSINAMRYFTSSIALPLLSSCAITSALLNLLTSVPSTAAFNAEQCTAALPPVVSTA